MLKLTFKAFRFLSSLHGAAPLAGLDYLVKRILVATLVYLKIPVYSPFADHSQGLYTAHAKQMVQT